LADTHFHDRRIAIWHGFDWSWRDAKPVVLRFHANFSASAAGGM
jgi:hypothetical protein